MPSTWHFPLISATENRSTIRTGIPHNHASELRGVDGSTDGGLRPFHGFRHLYAFDPHAEQNNTNPLNPAHGTATSARGATRWNNPGLSVPAWQATRLRSVSFRVGVSDRAYGFVFRVTSSIGGYDTFHIAYRIATRAAGPTAWFVREITPSDPDANVPTTSLWDVAVAGRQVFLFVEGRSPVLFHVDNDGGTYKEYALGTHDCPGSPGPGPTPFLRSTLASGQFAAFNDYSGLRTAALAADPASPDAFGQVILRAPVGALNTIFDQSDINNANAFPVTHPQRAAGASPNFRLLPPGDYSFMFVFDNPTHSRRAQPSSVVQVVADDFRQNLALPYDADTNPYVPKLAIIAVLAKQGLWTRVSVHRSGRLLGGYGAASYLWRDRLIDLNSAYSPATTTIGGTTYKIGTYIYEVQEASLTSQDIYLNGRFFNTRMPFGGAAIYHEGVLYVSSITNASSSDADSLGLGEIRWSSPIEPSPELFATGAKSRHLPATLNDAPIAFGYASANPIGYSRAGIHRTRRESDSIKVDFLHSGYGIINQEFHTPVGALNYYGTLSGCKAIHPDGALDDVGYLNTVFTIRWASTLSSGHMTYDAALQAMFITNAAREEAQVVWFQTGRITSLVDVPFVASTRGEWPISPTTSSVNPPTHERAFFLHAYGSGAGCVADVYTVDYDRSRTRPLQMMDVQGGDLRLTATIGSPNTTLTITAGTAPTTRFRGARIYTLNGANAGASARIASISGSTITIENHRGTWTPGQSVRVGVSPVNLRWVGGVLPIVDQLGRPDEQNFYKMRQVNVVGFKFVSISGAAIDDAVNTSDAKVRALVFLGEDEDPVAAAVPVSRTGADVESITPNSPTQFAAFTKQNTEVVGKHGVSGGDIIVGGEIFCPEADYRLISAVVFGEVFDDPTRGRPA